MGGGGALILRNRVYRWKSKQSILCQQIIPTALEAIKDAEYEGTYIRPVSLIS